jgi:hypothetical protein
MHVTGVTENLRRRPEDEQRQNDNFQELHEFVHVYTCVISDKLSRQTSSF